MMFSSSHFPIGPLCSGPSKYPNKKVVKRTAKRNYLLLHNNSNGLIFFKIYFRGYDQWIFSDPEPECRYEGYCNSLFFLWNVANT